MLQLSSTIKSKLNWIRLTRLYKRRGFRKAIRVELILTHFYMRNFEEVLPGSSFLDEELNAIRGGVSENVLAVCDIGKKGDLTCSIGQIGIDDPKEMDAC